MAKDGRKEKAYLIYKGFTLFNMYTWEILNFYEKLRIAFIYKNILHCKNISLLEFVFLGAHNVII